MGQFWTKVLPISSSKHWDWLVLVANLADGGISVERVSGGQPIVDSVIKKLKEERLANI